MVALLPIQIKSLNIHLEWLNVQWQTNREVLNEVLRRILQPLNLNQHPTAKSRYYNVLCAKSNFRCCKPDLAAWIVDCPEYSDLNHLEQHVCIC
jgi:hypothetical protein